MVWAYFDNCFLFWMKHAVKCSNYFWLGSVMKSTHRSIEQWASKNYIRLCKIVIIRAPWLSQYVRRFSCCRPGFKSRRGRGRFLVTQSDRPTLSYVFVLNVFDSRRRRFLVTQSDRSTFRIWLNGCVRLENDKVNSEIGSRTYNAFFVITIVRL